MHIYYIYIIYSGLNACLLFISILLFLCFLITYALNGENI